MVDGIIVFGFLECDKENSSILFAKIFTAKSLTTRENFISVFGVTSYQKCVEKCKIVLLLGVLAISGELVC